MIPFNKPFMAGKELSYIQQACQNGHLSGDGAFSRQCQEILETTLSVPKVLLTTSGTHALEMCALLLDIQPGDEVIVPSFTFPSTANAFVLFGATPVFADIKRDTLNLDPASVAKKITSRTKAIVPVHYAGVGCEMDAIQRIAEPKNISIVEDNAHGIFGKYRKKNLGTFGTCAALSFHETKNISCGEGGALLVNFPDYFSRSEILREKGTDRSRFFRGEVSKYTWVDKGSSYLPSEILAAYLLAQLEARALIQEKRKTIWEFYDKALQGWAKRSGVQLPFIPEECEQSYHLFYLVMPTPESRDRLQSHLRDKGILSIFHYQALHLSSMGKKFGAQNGDCPVSESVSERLLRLPFYNDLSNREYGYISDCIMTFEI